MGAPIFFQIQDRNIWANLYIHILIQKPTKMTMEPQKQEFYVWREQNQQIHQIKKIPT